MTRRTALMLGGLSLSAHLSGASAIHLLPNAASEFALVVKKTGLMAGRKHRLVFRRFEGVVSQEPSLQVAFTVQTDSLVCVDDWVKPKDQEKIARYAINDLLEAAKYPTLRYQSSAIQTTESGYQITGDLVIKNQTRPVRVDVRRGLQDSGPTTWTGSAKLRLTAFHLKPPTAALGAIGTEDEMELLFHLQTLSRPDFSHS